MSSRMPAQTKSQRRDAARAEALALKKKQEAADRRARVITGSVLGVVLLALVVVVAWLLIRDNRNNEANAVDDIPLSEVVNTPSTAAQDGGILITAGGVAGGAPDESVPTVAVYFDYMCPICGQFEDVNSGSVDALVEGERANVVLHPVAILDAYSQGTDYSTRAGAAFAWVADRAPAQALAFHTALYENQPAENTPGLGNGELADLAREVGVADEVAAGIASGEARTTYGQWVYSATQAVTTDADLFNPQSGAFGTPTITLDDVRWDGNWTVPGALDLAVTDATSATR